MAGPKQLQNIRVSALNANSSVAALMVHSVDTNGAYVSPGAGSTQVSIREILSSSGGSLIDSSNVSLGVTIRAGSAAGTEYTEGSTDATITGGAQLIEGSSDRLLPVQGSTGTPSTGAFGMWVREIPSTRLQEVTPVAGSTWNVRALQSSAADLNVTVAGYSTITTVSTGSVRVHQSTAADLNVTVAGYSTIVSVSTGSVRVHQSTYTDLGGLMRLADRDQSTNVAAVLNAAPASTVYGLAVREVGGAAGTEYTEGDVDATITGKAQLIENGADTLRAVQGSTSRPSTGALGVLTREVLNNLLSTAFSTLGNNSTSSTIVSSAAGLRHKVYAYSITSTAQAINTLTFASSLANMVWTMQMQSISSGISGANLAVTPPAWLFATEAASPLVFKVTGSTGTYHVSFSYFSEA